MNRSHRRIHALLFVVLLAGLSTTQAREASGKAPIAMAEVVAISQMAAGSLGVMTGEGGTLDRIKSECELQSFLATTIAELVRKNKIPIELMPNPDPDVGSVLTLEIASLMGRLGGSMTGTKSMTVRGDLREDGIVVASFVARRQQTALASGTCKAFRNCCTNIAKDIVKWLERPTMKARLGSS